MCYVCMYMTCYTCYIYYYYSEPDPPVRGIPVLFIPGNAGSYKQG